MKFFQHFARSPQTIMVEMPSIKARRSPCSIATRIGGSGEAFGNSANEGLVPLQNFPIQRIQRKTDGICLMESRGAVSIRDQLRRGMLERESRNFFTTLQLAHLKAGLLQE
jgi:hypothetical protein